MKTLNGRPITESLLDKLEANNYFGSDDKASDVRDIWTELVEESPNLDISDSEADELLSLAIDQAG